MDYTLLKKIDPVRYLLPVSAQKGMRVPGLIYADKRILKSGETENALQQVANVACLPGIVAYSFAMPDMHWGYGFPIGGVAAFEASEGIISPGGVGYDISCGVRLMLSDLEERDLMGQKESLLALLFSQVPCGMGSEGFFSLKPKDLDSILLKGAKWVTAHGQGEPDDLDRIEESGCLEGADPGTVSVRAKERGRTQLGTLGSGNHFLEIQVVDAVYERLTAEQWGLRLGQCAVMIHCGSRGLGHQVCDDYLKEMVQKAARLGISLPDRQLSCVPLESKEGKAYLAAMKAAANFALANREVIGMSVRKVFQTLFPQTRLRLLYDVSHNIAHIERHIVEGKEREVCVHRKGATRALPVGHPSLSGIFRETGQPVVIPGSMGTSSYLLVASSGSAESFHSTCHGAGRVLSRKAASKITSPSDLLKRLKQQGVPIQAENPRTISEEAPEAYKDIDVVVDIVERANLCRKVARLRPLAVIKG